MAKGKFIYHLLAFLVVAVWGVTFISTKVLIRSGLHPSQIFAIRFSLAYIGILVLQAFSKEKARLLSSSFKDEAVFLSLGVSGGSLYFLTENTALAYTQACNVAFIVCVAPLITILLSLAYRRLFNDRFSAAIEHIGSGWPLAIGTALALTGMALVTFDGNAVEFSVKGDLLALGAAVCWGLYSIFMGYMTASYGTMFATRKVFFYGLLTIIPVLFFQESEVSADALLSFPVWGNLLFLGLIASLACFAIWNKVMSEIGNVTATNYVYLNPFFTLVSAVLILGEKMTPTAAIGSAAIIAGVSIAERKKKI